MHQQVQTPDGLSMQDHYQLFVKGLTDLTRKHGIAINAFGGVAIADHPEDFHDVFYVADISSGDLFAHEGS